MNYVNSMKTFSKQKFTIHHFSLHNYIIRIPSRVKIKYILIVLEFMMLRKTNLIIKNKFNYIIIKIN